MPYRTLDHTADVAVEITAADRDALFAEALIAFTDTVTAVDRLGGREERRFAVEAADLPELMVEWLGELVFSFETEGLLFARAEVAVTGPPSAGEAAADRQAGDEAGRWRLIARAQGELFDLDRHPLKVLIKGVTYHTLAVEEREQGWRARVVFDI